ncbi:MAG: type II secretion system protein GspL [Myxococcota bacterium]|nr:type II secretion system protein GspL [Myxococcota bacterium]
MKNVLGLDLGSHSIKAVELRQTLRGLEPVQLRLHSRAESEAEFPDTLRRFIRLHHLPVEHVICALSGDRLSSRRLDFPFRDRKKLAQAVPFEVEGEVPFRVEDIMVDWQTVGDDRARATVVAAIAQRSHIGALLAELAEANCDPRVVEAEGFALANLTSLFDLSGTRLLADVGHAKTTLCLLMDGRAVSSRTLPIGGRALTDAIATDRECNGIDAERSKCEDGIFQSGFGSNSDRALAVVDKLSREIVRTLEALEPVLGGSPESQVSEITLCGGTAKLHRIDEYLSERTSIQTQRLSLPPEEEGAALVAGGDPVLFAPAIALALRGTAQATTRMNFRQGKFTYRTDLRQIFGRDMRPTAALAACFLVLLAATAATSITLDSRRAKTLEQQVVQLYTDVFPAETPPARPISAMRDAGVQARARADFLGVYGGNRSALDLLAELSKRVPEDLEVKFEEVTIDRRVVRIKVSAKSFEAADRLTNQLAASEPFLEAKIDGEVKASRKGDLKLFNVTIPLAVPGETS